MAYGTVNTDIVADSSGGRLAPISSVFRNRIINGAMVIDQRNAGASVTPASGDYTVDRFQAVLTQSSKFTAQQSTTAPTGFVNSLKITSSSAYSVAAGDIFAVQQVIEGYNIADLGFGTASAKTFTISFWVNCSLTGTFGGSLRNADNTRSYPFTYTISSANTWEQKIVTVIGDTSGTWQTTNSAGIKVEFGLGGGATYSGTAGSWASANYQTATGATSVVGTNGATFYITGVQLEVGSSATGFEYVNYQTSLANCQRYFQNWNALSGANTILGVGMGNGTSACDVSYPFKVSMRSVPTITYSTVSTTFTLSPGGLAISGVNIVDSSTEIACLRFVATVSNSGAYKAIANTTGAFINFSSEL